MFLQFFTVYLFVTSFCLSFSLYALILRKLFSSASPALPLSVSLCLSVCLCLSLCLSVSLCLSLSRVEIYIILFKFIDDWLNPWDQLTCLISDSLVNYAFFFLVVPCLYHVICLLSAGLPNATSNQRLKWRCFLLHGSVWCNNEAIECSY